MEDFVKDFDREFDNMSVGENLYAEAMAHLIDKEDGNCVEALGNDASGAMNMAAESDGGY